MKHIFIIVAEIGVIVLLILLWHDREPKEKAPFESKTLVEDFTAPKDVFDGQVLGQDNFLTFELFRNGTFVYRPAGAAIEQRSDSYRDAAYIRSTDALPPAYRIRVTVGMIEYDPENIAGLPDDPDYREGPKNENGCYLLTIVDGKPSEHYTNDWWHEHRKVVIDVDNNVWGNGMPNPVFMVYFDKNNELAAYDQTSNAWSYNWVRGIQYEKNHWYIVEIERTDKDFILRVYDEGENLLKEARAPLSDVWHSEGEYPDYFVTGDPHENYYQGSMQIKKITLTASSE